MPFQSDEREEARRDAGDEVRDDRRPRRAPEERKADPDEERRIRRLDAERDPGEEARDDPVPGHLVLHRAQREVRGRRRLATSDGKSDITDRPSDCGSSSSVYRWW